MNYLILFLIFLHVALKEDLQEFQNRTLRFSYYATFYFLLLILNSTILYFYVPVTIHFLRLLLGYEDLSYPLLMKANYVIVDPRKIDFTFLIYTIISRFYMNLLNLDFFLVGVLTLNARVRQFFFGIKHYKKNT